MVTNGSIKSGTETVEVRGEWRGAILPTLVLSALIVLPGFIKGLFEPFTSGLMSAYVTGGMLFIAAVMGGLAVMVLRDLSSRKTRVFRFETDTRPAKKDNAALVKEDHQE